MIYEIITHEELRAALDRLALKGLGVSGQDFVAQLDRGELDESSPTVSRLAMLARVLTVL
jgi:hypothetical protein